MLQEIFDSMKASDSLMQMQEFNEKTYSSINFMGFADKALWANNPTLKDYIKSFSADEVEEKFFTKLCLQMALQKCADLNTVFGIMRIGYPEEKNQWVLDLIKRGFEAGLMSLTSNKKFMYRYALSEEDEKTLSTFFYPLPSVVPMKKIRGNFDSGYQTLKGSGHVLNCTDLTKDRDICLDVLNNFSSMTFKVNETVLNNVNPAWDFVSTQRASESYEVYKSRVDQFVKFEEQSKAVLEALKGLPLHLEADYDFRGRLYDKGYHFHVQGKEWTKASVDFYVGLPILGKVHEAKGFKGEQFSDLDYLRIDIAGSFGLDKKTWKERIQWTMQHEVNGDLMSKELLAQADSLPLYVAGVQALYDAKAGKEVHYAVNLDGTASGTQLLGALLGDEQAMMICNVLPVADQNGEVLRQDSYTIIHKSVMALLGGVQIQTYFDPDLNGMGQRLMPITRAHSKCAVMRSFYGSELIIDQVYGEDSPASRAFCQAMEMHAPYAWAFNSAMLDAWDPQATEYNWVMPDGFQVHFLVEGEVAVDLWWGEEPVTLTYVKCGIAKKKGRALSANFTHSFDALVLREMYRRCHYNEGMVQYVKGVLEGRISKGTATLEQKALCARLVVLAKESGFLSARILECINPETLPIIAGLESRILDLIASLPSEPFELMSIHDCFRCLPRYGNDVRYQYTKLLAELNKSKCARFVCAQISPRIIISDPVDVSEEILEANYALS